MKVRCFWCFWFAMGMLLVLSLWVAPAGAQMGGPAVLIDVREPASPARATPGSSIVLRGARFDANGRPVEIRWGGDQGEVLGRAIVDDRGEFAGVVTVPTGAPAGPHLLTVTQKHLDDTPLRASGKVSIDVVTSEGESTVEKPVKAAGGSSGGRGWLVPAGFAGAAVVLAGAAAVRSRR